ncbi:Epstein-Barr virus EBNA-1-like [Oryza sativa Japonica Group]|uniref:Epstein-Barr virus EBNA-1-like n=1 Tax=Oryza sativa subsp. japonica TaxID=39947 RepID=Q5JNS5_ORYSJ|nr:Epstein-Barr virus EBNA-1-like [Oryza sativa Japonica Group]
MRRAHAQPHGSPRTMRTGGGGNGGSGWPGRAEVAPTWRLCGCHVGRLEEDEGVGRNGRRTAAASSGANHGDTGESEHTGRLHETRGDESTARICRRESVGGGLRRRQPAERKGGNGDEVMRGRFPARAPAPPAHATAAFGGRDRGTAMARARNGEDWEGKKEGRAPGFIGRQCRFWRPTLGGQGASWRSALAAKTATEADDAGGGEKRKKEGRKGACPLPLWEKKEGERAARQRGGGNSASVPWRLARGVDDDSDDGGGGVERSGDTGGRRGQARQRLTAAATRRSANTARARAARRFGRRRRERRPERRVRARRGSQAPRRNGRYTTAAPGAAVVDGGGKQRAALGAAIAVGGDVSIDFA